METEAKPLTLIEQKVRVKEEVEKLKEILAHYRAKNRVLLAYLFGSCAKGETHPRSDIDLALYLTGSEKEKLKVIEDLLLAIETHLDILRLDDEDESPFVIQEALKGIPLVEPDEETLYQLWHRVLHEAEHIRLKRGLNNE